MEQFRSFEKIARWSKPVVITEKIDGTNGLIHITPEGEMLVGSRSRYITPDDDNFGFARWAHDNKEELLKLGEGRHYGEWWGRGIQRNYGMKERVFSLFNVGRWGEKEAPPTCCRVVPVLGQVLLDESEKIREIIANLVAGGSVAAPGWMRPEGIIIYHFDGRTYFKHPLD